MKFLITLFLFTSLVAQSQPADTTVVDQLYNRSKKFIYGNRDSAIYYLDSAQTIANRINYTRGKAYLLYGYALNEPVLHKKFQLVTESLEIFDQLNDDFGRGLNLIHIGYIYDLIGDNEKSIQYYNRALEVKKRVNDYGGIALSLINIGIYYRKDGDPVKALQYFEESLPYRRKAGSKQGIAYAQLNIGESLLDLKRPHEAIVMADSSISNFLTTTDYAGQARALTLKAKILESNNQGKEALDVYKLIVDKASSVPYDYYVLEARKNLIQYYRDKNDINKAFEYQSEYVRVKDSLASRDYRAETQRLANEFEFRKAEEAAFQKEKDVQRHIERKNTLEYLGITILVFIFFAVVFAVRRKIGNSHVVLLLGLLLLFEFVLVLTDPIVEPITQGDPILKLIANLVLALLILPAHNFLERIIRKRVFEK